jgi:Myo-inositol-1-phosphate synthase.
MDQAEALMADIDRFRSEHGVERVVMVWCGSTETYKDLSEVHMDLESFEKGLKESHPDIGSFPRSTPTPPSSPTCRSPTGHPT